MSETPLQALIRKKKEAQALASAETQVTKLEEAVQEVKETQAEVKVGLAELTQGIAETKVALEKPMSAMDRIRAMKSGGSNGTALANKDTSVGDNTAGVVSASVGREEVKTPIETVLQDIPPPKPRKTHPIAMEMAELEAALNAEVPGFVSILSTIHKKLKADPNVVTLLDDEEIGVIVAGLEKHTNVTIVAPAAIKAAKSKAKKEPVSAMDL